MPRPKCWRMIAGAPGCLSFGPRGMGRGVPAILLGLDEFEAIRQADFEGLYQEQAAEKLHVSRQTFGRIIASARKKVAQSLIEGRPLQIEGGQVRIEQMRNFNCFDCGNIWAVPFGTGMVSNCPSCRGINIRRTDGGPRGFGRGRRRRGGNWQNW